MFIRISTVNGSILINIRHQRNLVEIKFDINNDGLLFWFVLLICVLKVKDNICD